jgi:hypothetical protein
MKVVWEWWSTPDEDMEDPGGKRVWGSSEDNFLML